MYAARSERSIPLYFFFFQAEDGIRDDLVTGVQTCALPILRCTPSGNHASDLGAAGISNNRSAASRADDQRLLDRKSTRLNSSHQIISYAVFCLKKKKTIASATPCSP